MSDRTQKILFGAGGVVGSLLLWQLIASMQLFGESLPAAVDTLMRFGEIMVSPDTWVATGETMLTAVLGLAIAIVIGVVVGILVGTVPLIEHATRVPIEFLKPIPAIVVLPVAVLVFGPKLQMGIFLAAFGCTIQILM